MTSTHLFENGSKDRRGDDKMITVIIIYEKDNVVLKFSFLRVQNFTQEMPFPVPNLAWHLWQNTIWQKLHLNYTAYYKSEQVDILGLMW